MGSFVFAASIGFLLAVCTWELFNMCGRPLVPYLGAAMLGVLVLLLLPQFFDIHRWVQGPAFAALLSLLCMLFMSELAKQRFVIPADALGLCLRSLLLFGVMGMYMVLLRNLPMGLLWVLGLVGLVWTNDIAAYLVGSSLGKRKLARSISPKKTVEGAVGAVLASVAFVLLFNHFLLRQPWATMLAFAVLGSVVAQFGDLHESLTKRKFRAKDSGAWFPGHGGVYDRIDSFLFLTPLTYYLVVFLSHS